MNNRKIESAIKKASGLTGVRVHIGEGMGIFYSDNETSADILSSLVTDAIYVPRLNMLTIEQWVEEFMGNIDSDYKRGLLANA